MQWNFNRWYNPAIQRWMSEDPIGFAVADANLFRYVGNAPNLVIDPTGLEHELDIQIATEKTLFPNQGGGFHRSTYTGPVLTALPPYTKRQKELLEKIQQFKRLGQKYREGQASHPEMKELTDIWFFLNDPHNYRPFPYREIIRMTGLEFVNWTDAEFTQRAINNPGSFDKHLRWTDVLGVIGGARRLGQQWRAPTPAGRPPYYDSPPMR